MVWNSSLNIFFLIKLIKLNTSKLHDKKASARIDIDMLQIICGKEKILLLSVQNERPASKTDLHPTTPDTCDSNYFLQSASWTRGQLQSDQELFSFNSWGGWCHCALVNAFSANQTSFFESFLESMIRTGNLSPLTGTEGEIRLNCSVVNANLAAGLDSLLVSSIWMKGYMRWTLQDLTVLPTEFFCQHKTRILSVINLPTESPTENAPSVNRSSVIFYPLVNPSEIKK